MEVNCWSLLVAVFMTCKSLFPRCHSKQQVCQTRIAMVLCSALGTIKVSVLSSEFTTKWSLLLLQISAQRYRNKLQITNYILDNIFHPDLWLQSSYMKIITVENFPSALSRSDNQIFVWGNFKAGMRNVQTRE